MIGVPVSTYMVSIINVTVPMHIQVLSSSIAKGLTLFVGAKATQTAYFADMFDKFFDCLNSSGLSGGKRSRNPFRSPCSSGSDWKLKVHSDLTAVKYIIYFALKNYSG